MVMKIGVIQASSQAEKNQLLFETVEKYAANAEIINFGCTENEQDRFSYVEIAVLAGLLLASGAVDFIVTGCSSGQGMMLACNSFPGVLCGYAPSPMDAYLFVQINNGNAVSLPLGENYIWSGYENFENTIARLFSEPFGQGYPKEEASRKIRDTLLLRRSGIHCCLRASAGMLRYPRWNCWIRSTNRLLNTSCVRRMLYAISWNMGILR